MADHASILPTAEGAASPRARWTIRAHSFLRTSEPWVALSLAAVIEIFRYLPWVFSRVTPVPLHLGAEYYNIAHALAAGRGYSDPFGGNTGPTAWMPPFFPFLMAGLLRVLRRKLLVANAVVVSTDVALVVVGLIVYRIAKRLRVRASPLVAVGLYVAWLWGFFEWFFLMTHDIWLVALGIALIALGLERQLATGRTRPWAWGGLGGLALLTSPSLAAAWVGAGAAVFRRAPAQRRALLASLLVAVALGAPWAARNALVFHAFIPVKSNLAYEAYEANYVDDDGIYDGTFEDHPYNSPAARADYARAGELGFLAERKARFVRSLRADPKRYLRAVVNRLLAVTVDYVPFKYTEETPAKVRFQRALYALPFAMLVSFAWLRGRAYPFVTALAAGCAAYLLPYVLVAFYLRYMMPLTPALVLFVFFGVDQLVAAYAARRVALGAPAGSSCK